MIGIGVDKQRMVDPARALPGRDTPMPVRNAHHVHGRPIAGQLADDVFTGMQSVQFGMGCFWGAERKFWTLPGVFTTAVGYAGGYTPNPSYREVCSGETGHAEVVLVIHDPQQVAFAALLKTFWEHHDPTQGMRQGGDVGTQYRSGVYVFDDAQRAAAESSKVAYAAALKIAGKGAITTEVIAAPTFYFAEEYHQQYLDKNPGGYCGLGGTGVACPIGTGVHV